MVHCAVGVDAFLEDMAKELEVEMERKASENHDVGSVGYDIAEKEKTPVEDVAAPIESMPQDAQKSKEVTVSNVGCDIEEDMSLEPYVKTVKQDDQILLAFNQPLSKTEGIGCGVDLNAAVYKLMLSQAVQTLLSCGGCSPVEKGVQQANDISDELVSRVAAMEEDETTEFKKQKSKYLCNTTDRGEDTNYELAREEDDRNDRTAAENTASDFFEEVRDEIPNRFCYVSSEDEFLPL